MNDKILKEWRKSKELNIPTKKFEELVMQIVKSIALQSNKLFKPDINDFVTKHAIEVAYEDTLKRSALFIDRPESHI